jgi:hypothetical protein
MSNQLLNNCGQPSSLILAPNLKRRRRVRAKRRRSERPSLIIICC